MKSYLVYILAFLMFTTAALYFLVAIFGESIESSEAHGLQIAEGQEDETEESEHNESQEEIHDEATESTEQKLQEQEVLEQSTSETKHIEGDEEIEEGHDETSDNLRRTLEFPLSISAGVGYAAIGAWMVLDKRNSKVPYIIATVGSVILLVLYFSSRMIGIFNLGIEPIGVFDSTVAVLQIAIIAISSFTLARKYTK